MSSLLTWSAGYIGPALGVNNGANQISTLKAAFDVAAAASDFPWQVCSSDLVTADHRYVTLKRKSGGSGRIVFVIILTGTTQFNSTIQNLPTNPTLNSIYCFYVGGATSDTPANIRGSGAIFTGQINGETTPVSPQMVPSATTTNTYLVYGNEDYVFVTHASDLGVVVAPIYMCGLFLVSHDDLTVRAGAFALSTLLSFSFLGNPSTSSAGAFARNPTTLAYEHWGTENTVPTVLSTDRGRDLSNKRIYFYPIMMGTTLAGYGPASAAFQMRQITLGPTALAANEIITDVGSVIRARSVGSNLPGCYWLTNIRLNV